MQICVPAVKTSYQHPISAMIVGTHYVENVIKPIQDWNLLEHMLLLLTLKYKYTLDKVLHMKQLMLNQLLKTE